VRVRSTLAPALLALACAGPAQQARTASAPAAVADESLSRYYPLAVGNEWTYELTAGEQRKRETIKIVGRQGAWFTDDHRGRLRFDAEGLRDEDHYLLRPPLERGKKWSAVANLVVQRFEVVATDGSEVTPAGTFLHCVTVRNEQPLPSSRGTFVSEWTYAPGVGMVRMRTSVVAPDGNASPQISLALVEFKLTQ
jgi:hypothetical protein